MSEEDFDMLASKYNLLEIEVSESHRELQGLSHKIKEKEDKTNRFLQRQLVRSERRLDKRLKHVLNETTLEEAREKKVQHSVELKEKFIIEVDKAVENERQRIADKRYHELQAELAIPQWLTK
jgi:hypothetical protein